MLPIDFGGAFWQNERGNVHYVWKVGLRLSFFERLKESTIGFSGYPRLARDKAGGFGYLAVLLLIAVAISGLINTIHMRNSLAVAANSLAAAPDFGLKNGEVYYNGPMPARFGDQNNMIIVDTTGQTTPAALNSYAQGILITKDHLYQKQSMGRSQDIPLSTLPWTFSKADMVGIMRNLWKAVPFVYIFIYLFQLGFKAIDAVLLGLVGMIWGSAKGRSVPFELGFKLGLYAMTIPIILQWVVPIFSTVPFTLVGIAGFFAWWGIAIVYLIGGLAAHYKSLDEESLSPDIDHP